MKKIIAKLTFLGLLAAAILAAPIVANAQDAAASAPAKPKGKRTEHLVFNGKLTSIDTNALTLTVGKRTFEVTSATKINKHGKPATLSEGVAGEAVSGSYKQDPDGKLTATTVNFGAKSKDAKGKDTKRKSKKSHSDSMGSETNSVPN